MIEGNMFWTLWSIAILVWLPIVIFVIGNILDHFYKGTEDDRRDQD